MHKPILSIALISAALALPPTASAHSLRRPSGRMVAVRAAAPAPRTPPVEVRLWTRLADARRALDGAQASMAGLRDHGAQAALREARRRTDDARTHLRNGAYMAADRTLDRAGELVSRVRRPAHELAPARAAAHDDLRDYGERVDVVRTLVAQARCGVADARLQEAEADLHEARHAADRQDWTEARALAHRAGEGLDAATRQAVARLEAPRRGAYRDTPLASARAAWTSPTVW
jgi:hypothetical protein